MRVEVRLFGGLPDRVGSPRLDVELPADATVGELRAAIAAAHPSLAPLLARTSVAVDLEVARDERPLGDAREVALLPPVAGGAGAREAGGRRVLTGLRTAPLDLESAITEVGGPEVGGIVSFLGTVRDHAPDLDGVVGLEYSAYPEMAERVLSTIADELFAEHPDLRGLALLHRVGDLAVGDHTILIVCAAAHRAPAFDACRDALERVKDRTPVWKRERTADGATRWVGLPGSP
jgi:MoaE-MoaD fusion protein